MKRRNGNSTSTKVSNENSKNSFNLKLTDSQIGSIGIRKIQKNNSKSSLLTLKPGPE